MEMKTAVRAKKYFLTTCFGNDCISADSSKIPLPLASLPIVARSATIERFYFALSGIGERRERGYLMTAQKHFSCPPPPFCSLDKHTSGEKGGRPISLFFFSHARISTLSRERDSPCFKEGFTRRERGGGKKLKVMAQKKLAFSLLAYTGLGVGV